ncbi:MAG TPA: hypothetical protein PLE71_17555 [Flavobacteriales bacterium]|nr:hypothetical protein [Flavobacteriales bacterium]
MKFDPVKFALLADGATLEEEGALIRLLRHLWITGPLSESAIKRITRAAFEFIHPLLVEDGDLLTLEVVEEARTYGIRRVNQRVEAGKKSAAKRSERSTVVEREPTTVGTDVLSISLSKSTSKSNSSSEKRANEIELPFQGEPFREAWAGYLAMRTKIKKPPTDRAKVIVFAKLRDMGESKATESLDASTVSGWTDVYPPKAKDLSSHASALKSADPSRKIPESWT